MFLRANSTFVKPTNLAGVLQRSPVVGPTRSSGPRFYSNSSGMDKQQEAPAYNTEDAMSSSFGEGYATRSDEEGFGGIYPGAQKFKNDEEEVDQSGPDYGKAQGSEVKEKESQETGRNQCKDATCN
ncbi:uncharacterized protein A4U43_C03F24620 [Asparagus officinalis]|uniref:Uncharacterized protein n=1 Tax=Asparagus officinalis TaxID=4686 RepID=A0A5P1FCP0_ASPOF|nr:uncharacterized protein LOC109832339 [Asparagus officinalis]ONK76165.1 uncharacterized protein A4U43_C03F24620 [Asparagus officinalis]